MFEFLFVTGLLVLCLPLAVLGVVGYAFFWVLSAVFKVTGAVVGTVLAIVLGTLVLGALIVFGIFCLPFLLFA